MRILLAFPLIVAADDFADSVHTRISQRMEGELRGMEKASAALPMHNVRLSDLGSLYQEKALVLPGEPETLVGDDSAAKAKTQLAVGPCVASEPCPEFPDCAICAPCNKCDDECGCIPGPCWWCGHVGKSPVEAAFSIDVSKAEVIEGEGTG